MQKDERVQLYTLKLIDLLRQQDGIKVSLKSLLEKLGFSENEKGMFPNATFGWMFAESIGILNSIGFIKMFDQDNNIIETGSDNEDSIPYDGYWSFDGFLRKNEKNIFISLTPKLRRMQTTLGVSITSLLSQSNYSEQLTVTPFFGKPSDHKTVDIFVLMPFKDELKFVYEDHIKNVCDNLKLSSERADNLLGSSQIMKDVWNLIYNSKIVIADCTEKNPNVFYELGIAHTLGKKVIVLTQDTFDIPFDIQHLRYIKYEQTPGGMKDLEKTLSNFIISELK